MKSSLNASNGEITVFKVWIFLISFFDSYYLQENEFLNMKIPLPSVEEQKNILDIYNKNKDLSKNQTGEVSEKSDYIEDFLKFSLGIDEIKVKKRQIFLC